MPSSNLKINLGFRAWVLKRVVNSTPEALNFLIKLRVIMLVDVLAKINN